MKHLLRASLLLLTAWCLALAGVQQAHASHAQGGQLTYEYVGTPAQPNRYKVTCRFFRDCSGIDAPASLTLNCRVGTPTTSCNSTDSRNFTATLVRGVLSDGSPYCTSVGNQCSSSGRTNYQTAKYEATVTLPPAASWTLSVVENARPTLANIPGGTDMYFEATLNNQLTLSSGTTATIENTSPQYQDQDVPVPFVCKEQRTTLTFSAFEPDGDSLVYSLDRPLDGCNQPSTYKPLSSAGGVIVESLNPPCVIVLPSATGTFSPTLPIPSYAVTGTCPVKTATSSFLFNAGTGSFTFTPYGYDANVPSNNKYVVVGKVTEYRKINGRYYVVGSVRRDMLVIIIDCGGNTVPSAPQGSSTTPGAGTGIVNGADSTFISVLSCNYSQVKVRFSDIDAGQQLTVTVAQSALNLLADVVVPNGYVLSGNGTTSPVMTFFFQPSPQLVGTIVRIPVTVEDNACPIKGRQNRIIVVRVIPGQRAQAVAATVGGVTTRNPVICYGSSVQLRGEVQRPDSIRGGLQQYSFNWTAAPGLPTSQLTNQSITANPTQTTRYRLRIAPLSGFSPGLCGDTTSIVVRVAPQVKAAFRATWADSTAAAALRQPNRQPRTFNFANFSSVNNVQTLVGIDSIKWTIQRIQDAQGNAVTEAPVFVWRQKTLPPAQTLSQAGVYRVTLSVANSTPGVTCPASVATRLITVPLQQMPNVFTPNKDGMNDSFIVQPDMIGGKMIIFNRWGRKIREYASYNNDWDGDTQPAGVYYYQVTAPSGAVTKGWVELVR